MYKKITFGLASFALIFTFVAPEVRAFTLEGSRFFNNQTAEYSEPTNMTPRFRSRTLTSTYSEPTCTISANPSSILLGDTTIIEWSTTDAYYVADVGGKNDTSGSITIAPNTLPYTYSITAVGPGGSTSCSVTVTEIQFGLGNYKTEPVFAQLSVPTNTLYNGTEVDLYRFSITADETGGLGIGKFTFGMATNGVDLSNVEMYAYTDSNFSTPISGFINGQIANNISFESSFELPVYPTELIQVPAGQTIYFSLVGDISGVSFGDSVTSFLKGDYTYASSQMETFATVDLSDQDNLIWSPNTSGFSTKSDADWTNGFEIAGLNSTPVSLSK